MSALRNSRKIRNNSSTIEKRKNNGGFLMSIYESLRLSSDNDFGTAGRLGKYPRIPVLNADQPAEIVGLTAPEQATIA